VPRRGRSGHSLHANASDVALPQRRAAVRGRRERLAAAAARALARVAAAAARVEAEAHPDVVARDARQVALAVARVREVALEQSAVEHAVSGC
jgi:phage protein D